MGSRDLSQGVDGMGTTLHDLRRKKKYRRWREQDSEAGEYGPDGAAVARGLEDGASTKGSSLWSDTYRSTLRSTTDKGILGPVTSRLENGLGNTSFSLHEQPSLLPYCSNPTHLADVAHDVMGARWRGGRPGTAKEIYPAGLKSGGNMEVTPDEVIDMDYPGMQRAGIQRGAGENGWLRGMPERPAKTRINFAPSKLTRTTYLSAQKRMHNTQALMGEAKKAGVRTEQYSRTPPAYTSGTGVTMGGKLMGS